MEYYIRTTDNYEIYFDDELKRYITRKKYLGWECGFNDCKDCKSCKYNKNKEAENEKREKGLLVH